MSNTLHNEDSKRWASKSRKKKTPAEAHRNIQNNIQKNKFANQSSETKAGKTSRPQYD